jgi:hypothetical protein
MTTITRALITALALTLPFTASAQNSDADYCAALAQKYQKFFVGTGAHHPNPGPIDGNVAVEQCKNGNTAAGIPVLEQKLRDAKVDLPKRG